MAFPAIGSSSTPSSQDTTTTTHTVNLPGSIAAGNLLVVAFHDKTTGGTQTWPADWTLPTNGQASQSSGSDSRTSVYYKTADGTEGATITVTTASATRSVSMAYRITGHENPAVQAPEAQQAIGTNAAPNPPSLTPTGGAKDYLWIVAGGSSHGPTLTAPTGFGSSLVDTTGATTAAHIGGSMDARQENVATKDPTFYTNGNASAEWSAVTLAIHPDGPDPSVTVRNLGTLGAGK